MSSHPEAFFLPSALPHTGQRFCLHHAPSGKARAAVVYVHPWCEEMNKSRRMAGLQARALASVGMAVLQIDLYGCGDSSGDFGDADWSDWLADVQLAADWLRARYAAPLWLWGLRSGCLLANQAAQQMAEPARLVFWQPPAAGRSLLQQFLRLKAASGMLEGKNKGVIDELKRQLAAGQAVDVAGYTLSPELAQGLEQAALTPPPRGGQVLWLEISNQAEASLLPASLIALPRWREAGFQVHEQVVGGPAFWQTVEIEEAPNLIDRTLALLEMAVLNTVPAAAPAIATVVATTAA